MITLNDIDFSNKKFWDRFCDNIFSNSSRGRNRFVIA